MLEFWEKLAGTMATWFGFGGEEDIAIGKDGSGNMIFKDQVLGVEPTLTQLLASGGGDSNIDGGRADTIYTVQDVDGGNASSF